MPKSILESLMGHSFDSYGMSLGWMGSAGGHTNETRIAVQADEHFLSDQDIDDTDYSEGEDGENAVESEVDRDELNRTRLELDRGRDLNQNKIFLGQSENAEDSNHVDATVGVNHDSRDGPTGASSDENQATNPMSSVISRLQLNFIPIDSECNNSTNNTPTTIVSAFYDTRPLLFGSSPRIIILSSMQNDHSEANLSCRVSVTSDLLQPSSNGQFWTSDSVVIEAISEDHIRTNMPHFISCLVSLEQHRTFFSVISESTAHVTLFNRESDFCQKRWIPINFMPNHPLPPLAPSSNLPLASIPLRTAPIKTSKMTLSDYFMPFDSERHPTTTDTATTTTIKLLPIAVCTAPLRGDAYAPTLRAWVEYHRMMGVERIFVYNQSIGPHMSRLLVEYTQQGIVQMIDWNILNVDDSKTSKGIELLATYNAGHLRSNGTEPLDSVPIIDTHYHGQTFAAHHCLLNSVGVYRWVAFVDFDELIVPRNPAHQNWHELINSVAADQMGKQPWFDLWRQRRRRVSPPATTGATNASTNDTVTSLDDLKLTQPPPRIPVSFSFRNVFFCSCCMSNADAYDDLAVLSLADFNTSTHRRVDARNTSVVYQLLPPSSDSEYSLNLSTFANKNRNTAKSNDLFSLVPPNATNMKLFPELYAPRGPVTGMADVEEKSRCFFDFTPPSSASQNISSGGFASTTLQLPYLLRNSVRSFDVYGEGRRSKFILDPILVYSTGTHFPTKSCFDQFVQQERGHLFLAAVRSMCDEDSHQTPNNTKNKSDATVRRLVSNEDFDQLQRDNPTFAYLRDMNYAVDAGKGDVVRDEDALLVSVFHWMRPRLNGKRKCDSLLRLQPKRFQAFYETTNGFQVQVKYSEAALHHHRFPMPSRYSRTGGEGCTQVKGTQSKFSRGGGCFSCDHSTAVDDFLFVNKFGSKLMHRLCSPTPLT